MELVSTVQNNSIIDKKLNMLQKTYNVPYNLKARSALCERMIKSGHRFKSTLEILKIMLAKRLKISKLQESYFNKANSAKLMMTHTK